MKVASFTNNSQSFVKYGDTSTHLYVQISEDGTFVDLTQGQKIAVPIGNDSGLILTKSLDPTTMEDSDSGIVDINLTADDEKLLTPDDYYLEIWVTNPDGTIGIYPAAENQLQFEITDNLTLITGDTVPAVALTDFENKFEELQQQVEDSIKNGLKGNDGEKGDTGNGIKTVKTQYQLNNSATVMPTGDWSDTIQQMTDDLPNLWVKLISTFTDNTTQTSYFVSSKGSKGEKGDTGLQGIPGQQGKGLLIKGKVDDISQLPSSGNDAGDGYFVGTDLYIWVDGKWENMGDISPDLTQYVKTTDFNSQMSNKQDKIGYTPADDSKVVHNSGDEEIAGKKTFDTAPIDKTTGNPYITKDSVPPVDLSNYATQQQLATKADDSKVVHLDDLLGGRNYLTNTSNPTTSNPIQFFGEVASIAGNVAYSNGGVTLTTATSGETYYRFNGANKRMPLQAGETYTISYTMSGTTGIYLATRILYAEDTVPTWENLPIYYHACTTKPMNYKDTFTVPDTALSTIVSVQIYVDTNKNSDNTGTNSVTFSKTMLEKGEVQHDSVPAPEDIADNMASKSDVTTAISTATANMVDSSKPTNFTAGLQVKGVDVATNSDTGWQLLVSKDSSSAAFSSDSYYRIVNSILYVHGTISVLNTANVHYQLWDIPTGWSIGDKAGTQTIYPQDTSYNNYIQLLAGNGSSYNGGLLVYEDKTGYSTDFRFVTPVDKV